MNYRSNQHWLLIKIVLIFAVSNYRAQEYTVVALDKGQGVDYSAIISLVSDKKIAALGEARHLSKTIIDFKAGLVKELHRQGSYNVVAFEGSLLSTYFAYLNINNDSAAMVESLYPVWHTKSVQDLFQYLQRKRIKDSTIKYCGFDLKGNLGFGTSKWVSTLIAANNRSWSDKIFQADSSFVVLLTKWEYRLKRLPPDSVTKYHAFYRTLEDSLMRNQSSLTTSEKSTEIYNVLCQGIRNRLALVQFMSIKDPHAWMKLRDSMMGVNLTWLSNSLYPEDKILVWAADLHISKKGSELYREGKFKSAVECLLVSDQQKIFSLGITETKGAPRKLRRHFKKGVSYLYVPYMPVRGLDAIVYLTRK